MKRFLVLLDCKYISSSYIFAVGELYDITANNDKEAIDLAKSRTCCKNPKVVKVEELSDNDKIPDLVTNCQVYNGNEWKSYSNGKLVEFSNSRINNFSVENDLVAFYKSLNEAQKLQFMALIDNFAPTNKMKLVLDSLANPKEIDNKLLKLNKINRSYLDKCIKECREIWSATGFNIDPKPFYDYVEDILARNLNRTGQLARIPGNQIDKYLLNNKKRYPEFKKQYAGDMPVEDIMSDILSATSDFLNGNKNFTKLNKNFSERLSKCFSDKLSKKIKDLTLSFDGVNLVIGNNNYTWKSRMDTDPIQAEFIINYISENDIKGNESKSDIEKLVSKAMSDFD